MDSTCFAFKSYWKLRIVCFKKLQKVLNQHSFLEKLLKNANCFEKLPKICIQHVLLSKVTESCKQVVLRSYEKFWIKIVCFKSYQKLHSLFLKSYQKFGFNHRAILLEATSYIYVIRKLWESWPTRVVSNIVTSVNANKYILLMNQKNVCLKRNKKFLYFIKCTSFNDVLRSVFIYFVP